MKFAVKCPLCQAKHDSDWPIGSIQVHCACDNVFDVLVTEEDMHVGTNNQLTPIKYPGQIEIKAVKRPRRITRRAQVKTFRFKVLLEPIPSDSDVMTINEFQDCVHCGLFKDSDGFGKFAYLAADNRSAQGYTDMQIYPSQLNTVYYKIIAPLFTHIIWFNK